MELNIKTPNQRKEESIKILKGNNIEVFDGLPVIEKYEDTKIRTKEEIVKRAIALCIISVYAEGICLGEEAKESRKFVDNIINLYNASSFFTEKEKSFLDNNSPTQKESIQFSWQYECYNVLLWSLNLIDNLGVPNQICDVSKIVGILKDCGSYESFAKKCTVREKESILDEADLIYRYNWACVDARINKKAIDNLDSGVVLERHRTLNWLINYMDQDWDNVGTDT